MYAHILIAYMRLSRQTYFRGVIPAGKLELGLGGGGRDMPSERLARKMTRDWDSEKNRGDGGRKRSIRVGVFTKTGLYKCVKIASDATRRSEA